MCLVFEDEKESTRQDVFAKRVQTGQKEFIGDFIAILVF